MAKYFGIGGRRVGSVGNETYALVKGNNVVKAKIIHVNDAKTPDQIEQRSKMQNAVKAFQNIGTEFLSKCFENKRQKQSTYNAFVSLNAKSAEPFFKKYSDNQNIIGIGNFTVSKGSLSTLPVIKSEEVTISEKKYVFYGIDLGADIDANANIGGLSTTLINKYNLKEGSLINAVSIFNEGVAFKNDVNDPITLSLVYGIKKAKNNFILSKTSTDTLASKGFKIIPGENSKYLVMLQENSAENPAEGCIYTTDNAEIKALGYCAYFVSQKTGNKVLVSTSTSNANKELEDLINLINADPQRLRGWLTTAMKILIVTSYGIKKIIEIIRDWPI